MPKLIQCIFRAPNNILSHARTPSSSPCSRRAAACATARGGRRRRRGGAESRPAGWPLGCRRAGAAARRGSARVCVRATDSHAACRRCQMLSVVLSAVCARVRACVFSTDAGGTGRERAGRGCYPEVRTAGRCRGGSQALRWQGIKCPESPAWRMGRFWDALGRSSQQRSQYQPEAPLEVPECAGALVTPLERPGNVEGSRWGAH